MSIALLKLSLDTPNDKGKSNKNTILGTFLERKHYFERRRRRGIQTIWIRLVVDNMSLSYNTMFYTYNAQTKILRLCFVCLVFICFLNPFSAVFQLCRRVVSLPSFLEGTSTIPLSSETILEILKDNQRL